jgi:hypothetical protein
MSFNPRELLPSMLTNFAEVFKEKGKEAILRAGPDCPDCFDVPDEELDALVEYVVEQILKLRAPVH